MKKSLFFVALGAMALTSCSQDEVKQVNQDAVEFSVVTENAGRGAVITTESIKEFNVTAYLQEEFTGPQGAYTANGKVFMDAMNVEKNGDVWTPNVTKFWPTEGAINFYSYAPLAIADGVNFGAASQTIAYEVPTTCADQQDVLYAFNSGLTKANKNVPVNFRHALSQIIFRAKNTKADLEVEIVDVRVVNVKNSGVLTMPKIQTSSFLYNADPMVRDTETDDTWGKWDLSAAVLKSYPATMRNADVVLTGVTPTFETMSLVKDPLLLMPQELTPATITDNYMTFDGAFFAIKCKIYSIEDGNKTLLWPKSEGYAEVAIPVTSPDKNAEGKPMWKQGKKYIYTFVFGEGAGYIGPDGIEPDPNDPGVDPVDPNGPNTTDPNEPGDPVLVPVTFTVTVDMFQTAKEAVDMNTGN